MSALSIFLESAIDYEKTHQLILNMLLKDSKFVKALFGVKIINPKVLWEYKRGLFDFGVGLSKEELILMIELKMWSGLSSEQLSKQTEYLKDHKILGVYILLGTSDIEYVRDDNRDDIAKKTNKISQKIGYVELIAGLTKYINSHEQGSDIYDLVLEYKEALDTQFKWLYSCANNKSDVHKHFYYYSIYQRLRDIHIKEKLHLEIYTENNRGGASYILNDKGTWFKIIHKGVAFELFQEVLNGVHLIRLRGNPKHNKIKKELAVEIKKKIQNSNLLKENYDYTSKV